jgi:hypothetical protein
VPFRMSWLALTGAMKQEFVVDAGASEVARRAA